MGHGGFGSQYETGMSRKGEPPNYGISASLCPFWVKSAVLTFNQPLPVYPDQRTLPDRSGWSVWCQKRKSSSNILDGE